MLTSILKALVKNLIKESFYGKKKVINVLTIFSFFIKVMLKFSLIGFLIIVLASLLGFFFLKTSPQFMALGSWVTD